MRDSRTPDWSELTSLVDTLLDTAPEHRAALITELSAGDATRQSMLERLLAECEREPLLLSRTATDRFPTLLEPGTARFPDSIAERYQLVRQLARGGMATVYLARDCKHSRDVAVKVVHPAVASALGAGRFLREIEIAAQLHHPNIVPVYDSGEADGALFYVMPYEPEPSLRQRLARDGPLPIDDVLLVLRDVCEGLAYAHRNGIVHRDIKPDNVLLTGRHAMITDFGVAKVAAGTADVGLGLAFGTPQYMAPEQIAPDGGVDHRADIYAVGVMAYELLTGRSPFAGATPRDILDAHLVQAPVPVTTYRSDVPAPLADLVMKCLNKRPAERWQRAEDLVQRLLMIWRVAAAASAPLRNLWANARVEQLTDFTGSEVDAAISADGRLVGFLADRGGVFDAFVTELGSGEFLNVTTGRFPHLFNEDVRNVGFSADASHIWLRVADAGSPSRVSIVPTTGGSERPLLDRAATAAWSPDGSMLAYHETAPGDPIYVADGDGRNPRRVFSAEPGVHCHHVSWSPDGRFVYFTHGLPPDDMDVWRVSTAGGTAERITTHNSKVAYPVVLDDRTLLYTATADDGTGPWLYTIDLDDRVAHRLSTGIEHYLSIAASLALPGQPRRLVATVSNPNVHLRSIQLTNVVADERAADRVALPTARSAAPRFGPDSSLWYLASRGGADGLWRRTGDEAVEVWRPSMGPVVGAAAVSPDGSRVCFPVRRQGRSMLYCTTNHGTDARVLAESLDVRGAASWSPDGEWIAFAAKEGAGVRLFKVPAAGGRPVRLVDSPSSNPVWSPDGDYILYSGTPRARRAPLEAVTPQGKPYPVPTLSVDRVGDSYRFLTAGRELVVKLGGLRHEDLWSIDLGTGNRRRLTALRPGDSLHRFDVSRDGQRIVFERVRENSNVVLIELQPG